MVIFKREACIYKLFCNSVACPYYSLPNMWQLFDTRSFMYSCKTMHVIFVRPCSKRCKTKQWLYLQALAVNPMHKVNEKLPLVADLHSFIHLYFLSNKTQLMYILPLLAFSSLAHCDVSLGTVNVLFSASTVWFKIKKNIWQYDVTWVLNYLCLSATSTIRFNHFPWWGP